MSYTAAVDSLKKKDFLPLIKLALKEDHYKNDITTNALCDAKQKSSAKIISYDQGVLAGIEIAQEVFRYVDSSIQCKILKEDKTLLKKSVSVLELSGPTKSILIAERTALNFLSFMSGIATQTRQIVQELKKYKVQLVDTRKTLPGYRMLSKYSTQAGGAVNHRLHLADMGLIKDNHIMASAGISEAIQLFRKKNPQAKLEVEIDHIKQLEEVLPFKPDFILLDNMSQAELQKVSEKIVCFNQQNNCRIFIEASGGFTISSLHRLKNTKVDFVSMGSITANIQSFNFSLEF